ncbi:unnamed protein product [Auanema sp. JU1783]|nr:unnamed protein product [Auanema sp. JU1783]
MRGKVLFALLGCLLLSGVFAEDVVDGEINDEATKEDFEGVGSSPDATVSFVFTQPEDANTVKELYGGKYVKFLIGFRNKGEKDFIVKHSETSFRYALDYNYYIQNFTAGQYNRRVAPKEEVTLDYVFFAHDSFAGRPLGLVVNVHYEDAEGKYFINNVFNQTVNVLEDDSGFNTETGFLYLLFAGIAVGLLLVGQHYLNKLSRKTGLQKRRVVEQGTKSSSEVDYEWIPRDLIKQTDKKSPKPVSPKTRKAKKAE